MLHYLPIGFSVIRKYRPRPLFIRIDDSDIEGTFTDIVVCNTRNYGGIMSMTPDAVPDDGRLNVCLIRHHSVLGTFRRLLFALAGWKSHGTAEYMCGKKIEIRSSEACPAQTDGDPADGPPLDISIGTRQFKILVPNPFTHAAHAGQY
jgi:diacylglycerol kinase (ATP)